MSKRVKIQLLNWDKPSTKIIITVFSGLLILSGYFIFYINYSFINNAETQTLNATLSNADQTTVSALRKDLSYQSYKTRFNK
mgnify:CR=1 FL=1